MQVLAILLSCFALSVALVVQWRLEREVNNRKQAFVLHFANVMFTLMVYSTAYVAFIGIVGGQLRARGWGEVFIKAYVYPFVVLLLVYPIIAVAFRSWIRPYIRTAQPNVVVIKKRYWQKTELRERE